MGAARERRTAASPRWLSTCVVAAGLVAGSCHRAAPPSRFPSARAAIERMRATHACSRGLQGEAKADYFGAAGRLRGNVLFLTSRPESIRFDVFSPFGVMLSTVSSDGRRYGVLDLQAKDFAHGPAGPCVIDRFLKIPIPASALLDLLGGEAPVLRHAESGASLEWASGMYVVTVAGTRAARQEIVLEPHPDDWERPWQQQRVRVQETTVWQRGVELYKVEMRGHAVAHRAAPRVDPDGIEPDLPPSGPRCEAEIPRRLLFTVQSSGQEVLFEHEQVTHNPPLLAGVFRQTPPAGVRSRYSPCAIE